MLTYGNNADTAIFILHEIYGINSHISKVCEALFQAGFAILVPDLLNGKTPFAYSEEEMAYSYFCKQIGFDKAFSQVSELLALARAKYRKTYVLGYSVGATVAWRCSGTGLCDGIIGFYGSRIRDYLAIEPLCPGLLLFPVQEKSFPIAELMVRLKQFKQIRVLQLSGQHGFADPFSDAYNKQSEQQAWLEVRNFINAGTA
jgi:dienelactone hydrolase